MINDSYPKIKFSLWDLASHEMGGWLSLSEPQLHCVKNGDNKVTHFSQRLGRLNVIVCTNRELLADSVTGCAVTVAMAVAMDDISGHGS